MNKYQDALNWLYCDECFDDYGELVSTEKCNDEDEVAKKLLLELIENNERLVAHVKLAIKMLEENSPYAIETLKEIIEQDWSENENR